MFGLRCVSRCVWFKLVSLNPPLRHHNQVCKILHCISQSIIMYSSREFTSRDVNV